MTRRFARLALIGLSLAAIVPAALAQDEPRGPLRRLQGEWTAEFSEGGTATWVFKEETATVTLPDGIVYKSTVSIVPNTEPIEVDFAVKEGPAEAVGQTVKGLLGRADGKLTVVVAAPGMDRPGSLDAPDTYRFALTRKEGEGGRDLRRMQGTWKSELPDGKQVDYVIKGSKLVAEMPNRRYEITMTIDPDAKPHATVDMKVDDGPESVKGQTNAGIYEFKDGKLRLCISGDGERPTEFATEEGKSYLFELTRVNREREKDE